MSKGGAGEAGERSAFAGLLDRVGGWLGRALLQKESVEPSAAMSAEKAVETVLAAAKSGDVSLLRVALEAFPGSAEARNPRGEGALMIASWEGHAECVKELLGLVKWPDAQCDDGRSALGLSVAMGHLECVRALLPHCNPNRRGPVGSTPLMSAALLAKGAPEMIELLLTRADPNWTARDSGVTALMLAAQRGRGEAVEALLAVSDIEARCAKGRSAADHARSRGYHQIADQIEGHRARMLREELSAAVESLGGPGSKKPRL